MRFDHLPTCAGRTVDATYSREFFLTNLSSRLWGIDPTNSVVLPGVMYQSNRSRSTTPTGIPRAFDAFSCPVARAFDHHSSGVGNLIANLDVMLRVALIPRGLINHGGDGGDKFWWIQKNSLRIRDGLVVNKRPTIVFYNINNSFLGSITSRFSGNKPALLPPKALAGGGICPGRREFEQKFSKNSNARGGARGGCWSFDLTGTLVCVNPPLATKTHRLSNILIP